MAEEKTIFSLISPFWWGILSCLASYGIILIAWKYVGHSINKVDLRDIVLAIFTPLGVGLAVWRSIVAMLQTRLTEVTIENSRTQAKESSKQAAENLQESRDQARASLLQDRYQAGANMLGSNSMATRIGGIHALHAIANTESMDYYIQIMELLAIFIVYPTEQFPKDPKQKFAGLPPFPSDVQIALYAILNRSEQKKEQEAKDWRIDLAGANLTRADMHDADLIRIKLDNANLSDSDLSNVTGLTKSQLKETYYNYTEDDLGRSRHYMPNLTGVECFDTGKYLTHTDMREPIKL